MCKQLDKIEKILQEAPFSKAKEDNQDGFPMQKVMQPKPPPKFNQRVISPHFNQPVNLQETFPPARPRPAPRQAQIYRQQPPRPPPPRRTPSPVRPNSGNKDQERGRFSPESPEQNFSKKPSPPSEQNRPDSGSKPPGKCLHIIKNVYINKQVDKYIH